MFTHDIHQLNKGLFINDLQEKTEKGEINWTYVNRKMTPVQKQSGLPVIYLPFAAFLTPPFVSDSVIVVACVMDNGEYVYKIFTPDEANPFKETIFNAVGGAPNSLTQLFDAIRAQHPDKKLWKK